MPILYALSDNPDESYEIKIERTCYVCGDDLTSQYKEDATKQNNLHQSTQKFPEMVLWNRVTVEICGGCFKAHSECMTVYKDSHPNFEIPKPMEFN